MLLIVSAMIFCLCGCGSNGKPTGSGILSNTPAGSNNSENLLDEAANQTDLPALSAQTVEEELKSSGMAKQYSLRADKFEITNVSMDPDGRRQVVTCHIALSNDICTAEESADIVYTFNDAYNSWQKESCLINSKSITPKSNPSDDDVRAKIRDYPNYDKETNWNIEILSKGNIDGDVCTYIANARTVSPSIDYRVIYSYIETSSYTVNYSFNPTTGWYGTVSQDSNSREYSVKNSISGHYEGDAEVTDADTTTRMNDIHYSFDLTVSADGKDIVLSNLYIGSYPYSYPVTNQAKIPAAIQDKCRISFRLANPQGAEESNYVGSVDIGYLDDEGALAIFNVDRMYQNDKGQYYWGRKIDFVVPLHY